MLSVFGLNNHFPPWVAVLVEATNEIVEPDFYFSIMKAAQVEMKENGGALEMIMHQGNGERENLVHCVRQGIVLSGAREGRTAFRS